MNKQTMIDRANVLKMALVGFTLQRDRIEAAMTEIQAELDHGSTRPSAATATASDGTKTTGKRKFSIAARKRMALAQKKRWQLLNAKKAEASKPERKVVAKRKKVSATATRKQGTIQIKAVQKVAQKIAKAAPKVRKAVTKPGGGKCGT